MRILFYFRTHFDDPSNKGVVDKCQGIVQGFAANGAAGDAYCFSEQGLEKPGEGVPVLSWPNKKKSINHLRLYYFKADKWLSKNIDFQQYTHFFIRHLPANPGFIALLKTAKTQNPAIKILLELPTWPYDEEASSVSARFVAAIDRYYRKRLPLYTDYVLHYGLEPSIMGIPAINISNGIRWQEIPVRRPTFADRQTLRLIAVGNWNKWHGLDRVIHGMVNYFQSGGNWNIQLNIVGNGPEVAHLRQIARDSGWNDRIHFHPPCSGTILQELFDQSDIAVGVLGLHRKGLEVAAPLKHRDYCARGIPFIMAGKDLDFQEDWPFMLRLPDNDAAVEMERLIQFWQQLPAEYIALMREYAETHLGWDAQLQAVFTSNLHVIPSDPTV